MQKKNHEFELEKENLALESCPEPVQVMPPELITTEKTLAPQVLGNVVVGILLLGGLMFAPVWFFNLLTFF